MPGFGGSLSRMKLAFQASGFLVSVEADVEETGAGVAGVVLVFAVAAGPLLHVPSPSSLSRSRDVNLSSFFRGGR